MEWAITATMLIDIRCQHCSKLLCRVSRDFYGVVEVVCLRCRESNTVSLAVVLKQLHDEPALTIDSPSYFSDSEPCGYCQRPVGKPHEQWCRQ
jgi:phage FluMu protein Com